MRKACQILISMDAIASGDAITLLGSHLEASTNKERFLEKVGLEVNSGGSSSDTSAQNGAIESYAIRYGFLKLPFIFYVSLWIIFRPPQTPNIYFIGKSRKEQHQDR